jgi:hypothetical protein
MEPYLESYKDIYDLRVEVLTNANNPPEVIFAYPDFDEAKEAPTLNIMVFAEKIALNSKALDFCPNFNASLYDLGTFPYDRIEEANVTFLGPNKEGFSWEREDPCLGPTTQWKRTGLQYPNPFRSVYPGDNKPLCSNVNPLCEEASSPGLASMTITRLSLGEPNCACGA